MNDTARHPGTRKFKDALANRNEFIVTCEFVPGRGPRGGSIEGAIEFGKKVVEAKLPLGQ